jgi:hypothetical protein
MFFQQGDSFFQKEMEPFAIQNFILKAPEIHSSGLFVHFSELIQLNGAKVFILAAPKSMFSFVGIYFFNCLTIKN